MRSEVDCGVSVGIPASLPALLDEVATYVDAGYRRIKLKIEPGWDVEAVRAVPRDVGRICRCRPMLIRPTRAQTGPAWRHGTSSDLLLVEQPLPEDDLRGHALLAERITTPVMPGRVDHLHGKLPILRSPSVPRASSISSPDGSAAISRPRRSTTCAWSAMFPCGCAACSRLASDGAAQHRARGAARLHACR